MSIQDWFPLGRTDFISLQSKGLSRVFSNITVQKHQFFGVQLFFIVQLSHPYTTTGKTIALTKWTFVGRKMSLLFNMLSRLVIAFLPGSKQLLISWLQSPSAVILESNKKKRRRRRKEASQKWEQRRNVSNNNGWEFPQINDRHHSLIQEVQRTPSKDEKTYT